jgi:hypothetical protein
MIIIHQMAKVGSTAIYNALNRAGIETLQTHNLGEQHLIHNIRSFLNPMYPVERLRNELGLFNEQIIASKQIELSRLPGNPRQKIITLSRDPVIRWFSALVQNFSFLKPNVDIFFEEQNGKRPVNDLESFDCIFNAMLKMITQSDDMLGSDEFKQHFLHTKHLESENSNNILRQIGAELMVPFTWFQSNILDLIGIDIYAQPITDGLLITGNKCFDLLYIKFENLRRERIRTEQVISEFAGKEIKLISENVSQGKEGFDALQQLEDKYFPLFMDCPNIRNSVYCRHFKYPEQS